MIKKTVINQETITSVKAALKNLCETPKALTKTETVIALKPEIQAARKKGATLMQIKKALEDAGIFVSHNLISQYTTTKAKKHNDFVEVKSKKGAI